MSRSKPHDSDKKQLSVMIAALNDNQAAEQVMHGLLPKRVEDIVLHAMTDHERLSLEVLDNEAKSWAFSRVIYKLLITAGGLGGDDDIGRYGM